MATESDIVQRESGGDPYVGYSGVDLSKAPLNKYGFPIWSGAMGPDGISHAAGLYQFEPKTWEEGASALGITDFSPASQKKVYDYTRAKYGEAPWAASAPGGSSKLQPEGYYGGALHVNVKPDEDLGISPESALLLSSILQQHYPSEDKSTGNSLLDGIMQSQIFGFAGEQEQQRPLDLKPLEQATPHVRLPETVAALQEQPVVTQPLSQPSAPAIPPPAQSQQPQPQTVPPAAPEQFIEPPGKGQQVPPAPVPPQTRPVIQPSPQIAAASLIPANPAADIFEQAKRQYPILDNPAINYKFTPRSDGPMLEAWPPGETGTPDRPRPKDFPAQQYGIEVYNPKTRPIDVLGDVVSHFLVNSDPTIKDYYSRFSSSLSPQQEARLREQYQHARQYEGETRPYAQWRETSGLPAYFRGYPFQQWPKEFNDRAYTPEQKRLLDDMMKYLETGSGVTEQSTGNALLDHILSSPKQLLGPHPAAALIGNMLTSPDLRRGAAIPAEAFTAPGTPQDQEQAQAEIPSGADTIANAIRQYVQDVVSGKKLASSDILQNNYDPTKSFAENARNPAALGLAADIALGVTGGEGGRVEPPRLSTAPMRVIEGGKAEVPEAVPGATVGHPGPPPTEPPRGTMPPATPMPPPKGVKAEAQGLDDDLFRAAQSAEADRLEAQHLVDALPAELKGAADEQAYHERESRMTGKPIKPSSTTERIEKLLKPLDDKIHEDATWIREHADDIYKQLKEVDLKTAEQGYVHRKVAGQKIPGEMLDPERGDIISGLGGGLSRRASGLMHRTKDFVLEDNAGNRVPGRGPLVGQKGGPARYGETITDPRSGVKYTVKEPTTAELEAKYPQRKYVKSLLANTIDNSLRLSRVRTNVEILEKWKPRLQEAGHWMPENAQIDHPRNFVHVDVPQLRGWAEPHIASVLNDIYRVSRDDVVGMLQKVNKFLIGTMFSLPVRHQLNVAAHYAVGRGFDWVYRNPQLARAYTEVATQGPNYLRYLRAGAGLRYATTLNENFYNTLLSKLFHDQMTDPEWQGIFKELGHKAADVVRAEYAWSRRALWKVNDVFLTARIMELEKAGKPLNEAIKTAEDEIPNYRLPTNNLIARKLISSPYIAFGRYGYGRASALAKTAMNLVGPNATGEERLRALGQALIMVVIGTEGYKIGNAALNGAQQQINQALGPKWGPRVAGAKPLTIGGIGPFGPTRATAQYIGSQLGLNDDEKGWASLLGSWISLAPAAELPAELAFNRNTFTGQPVVNENSSALGKMVQFGEATLGQLNPVQLAIDSARKGLLPGIGPQFGAQQEYKGPPGKIQRMLRRQAGRQEARDPIEQGIKGLLGR